MPLGQAEYSLKNVRFTMLSGTVVDAVEVQISTKVEFADRTSGGSIVAQRVIEMYDASIKVKGWNTSNLTLADIPYGDGVTSLTLLSVESGTPSLVPAIFWTHFPVDTWAFGNTDSSFGPKPSQWETEIMPNVLNVGFGLS